ncbi:MAG TPA: glycosyltransferase family 39 protein [Verrucomicrobiae bacterium]|jgi:4-amino-4-deoxy-L-arabinose transferase-like glycosyltransferase|nr:glycosyltransferase family 39 protein [Verrucomicrobiae bacterium]
MALDQFLFWNFLAPLGLLLKTGFGDARLNRLSSTPPIRSRAAGEGSFEIPWWGIPLVLIVLYVCLFSGLGAIGLVGPDEPRYAAIARAMAETHDWITPRLWGTPWFEKPVLYYWAAGMAMRIFGVSEFAARLPSALAGLLAVVAIAWTALRSYGLGAAWYSLLMLPTSVAMIGFSRAAGPDMLFAGLITAAMAAAVEMLQTQRPSAFLRTAFGFFLGAAVLAKGPAAVILAGGTTLIWAAISRNWLAPLRFLHPLVVAVFCATALPWYVLCALRNPDFLRVFIWQHNFERYTTPIFEHRQPVWFYGYILLLAVLPWIAFFFGALFRAALRLKQRAAIESADLFFVCWAVFPILFFTFSQSKLPSYILPAIPPLFLLLGRWVSESIQGNSKAAIRALAWTGVALLLAAAALAATGLRTYYYPSRDIRVGLLIFILGAAVAVLAFKKRMMASFAVMALTVVAAVKMANFVVLPELDSVVSNRQLATKLSQDGASHGDLALYRVSRETEYGLNYYLERKISTWVPGKSEPEWILGCPPMDTQIADRYEVVDDNPLNRYIPLFSLYRRK